MRRHVFVIVFLAAALILGGPCWTAAQDKEVPVPIAGPLDSLYSEVASYFKPLSGKITAIDGQTVTINLGADLGLRAGMRLSAFREGTSFIHPVTKEALGKIEMPVGVIEVTETAPQESKAAIVSGKAADFEDANVKIPGTKARLFFSQGAVPWHLGDAYYQMVKEGGRFELVDARTESGETSVLIEEARKKNAEVALILDSKESPDTVAVIQHLYWVKDGKDFSEKSVTVDVAHLKELRSKSALPGAQEGEILLTYKLPFGARRLAVGDFKGDGKMEIAFTAGSKVRIYNPEIDLSQVAEVSVPSIDDILWIDAFPPRKGEKDLILITGRSGGSGIVGSTPQITSFIYEWTGKDFMLLQRLEDTFLRRLDITVIGQEYDRREGFAGAVYTMEHVGGLLRKDKPVTLPQGVNIYDFQYLVAPDGRRGIVCWNQDGTLSLYNERGLRIWRSRESKGTYRDTVKIESPTRLTIDGEGSDPAKITRGTWSVKERLVAKDAEVLVREHIPLTSMARGLGIKRSEIWSLWWNGVSVEERKFIADISGEILDYALLGDRVIVLAKPLLGFEAGQLLKASSPFVNTLSVYSVRGR